MQYERSPDTKREEPVRHHKVMLGDKVLYQAAQLTHAERFAAARRAEGVPCHVVPDTTPKPPRREQINPLTGQPRKRGRVR